jgi:hypothetical protein
MRGTGRTTRILKDAIANAKKGKLVVVYGQRHENVHTHLKPTLIQLLMDMGHTSEDILLKNNNHIVSKGMRKGIYLESYNNYGEIRPYSLKDVVECFDNDITDELRYTLEMLEHKNYEASLARKQDFDNAIKSKR